MTARISRHRTIVVGTAATVAALLLAGCGNGSGSSGTGTSPGSVPSVTKDDALAAKVPAAIKADGTITVGTDATYAPSEFLDKDGKTVVGFDVDLFNAVAAKLGLKATYTPAKFDAIIPGITSGKYEAGVSSFTVNPDRKKQVEMVSYFSAGTQWLTKSGNPDGINPEDACGKKVAVQTSTVQDTVDLPARDKKCAAAGKPSIKPDRYQGQDAATSAVVSGKDQAMLADSPVIAYAVKQTGGQLQTLGDVYGSAPYGYVVKKGETGFAQTIADAVKALIADGTYKKVLEKWGVQGGAIDNPAVNP